MFKRILATVAFFATTVSLLAQGLGTSQGMDRAFRNKFTHMYADTIYPYTATATTFPDTLKSSIAVVAPVIEVNDIYEDSTGQGITVHDSTTFLNDVVFAQSASEFFIIHGDNDTTRFDMRENLYVLGIKVNGDTLFSVDSTGVLTVNKFGGNVIYVGSEENFEFNKVDDAINAASAGDVIAVLPGAYSGHIDADVANIKIIGLGGWKRTTLNLTMSANAGIDVTADNVVIDGFTLSGNAAGSLILIGSAPDSVCIQNCKFRIDGAPTFGLNISTAGSDYTIVRNNLFTAGSGDGCFYGNKTITNLYMCDNEFIGQDSTSSYAIQTAGLNNAVIKNNKIHGEGHASGAFASGVFFYAYNSALSDSIYIEGNTISDCSKAIRLGHTSADFDLDDVFITGNTLHNNSRGVYVANDANCDPSKYQLNANIFYNNTVDIRNDYSVALAPMSNFFGGYFETDELNVLDSLRNEGTELTKGLSTFKGGIDADYAETATASDPYRYHDFRVDVNATQTASAGGGLATLYGRIDWDKGDNSTASLGGVEGVGSSSSADEAISLRGGHFRTYINANADATGSTARTSVGAEISARAGYSVGAGDAVQPEGGTAFVGARIWMAPYFATSVANINNFHGLWLYNEHPTYDVTNAIYINSASGGGSWTNFLNFRSAADAQMFGVAKNGDVLTAGDVAVNGNDITSTGDITLDPAGLDVLVDGGLTVGSATQAGDNNLRVEGTSALNAATTISVSGSAVGLSVDGNKTTGDLVQFINDDNGSVGDSTFRVTKTADVYGRDFYVDGGDITTTSGALTLSPSQGIVLVPPDIYDVIIGKVEDQYKVPLELKGDADLDVSEVVGGGLVMKLIAASNTANAYVEIRTSTDSPTLSLATNTVLQSSYTFGIGSVQWSTLDSINGAVIAARSIPALSIASTALFEDDIDASSELAAIMDDETGTGALVFGTNPTIADSITVNNKIKTTASSMTLDVTGTGNSYVEILQDNNAGVLAVGRTTATESSMLSITDGGADNEPGLLSLYDDEGTGHWTWMSTSNVLRGAISQPADDDAGGYAIMDYDDGTMGASTQPVLASTITASGIITGLNIIQSAEVWVTSASQNPALVTLPANAKVLSVECWVSEAFTSDGTDEITIGYDSGETVYATAIDVSSTGVKTVTLGTTAKTVDATSRGVEAYYTNGGSEPGAGKAHITITWHQCTVSP